MDERKIDPSNPKTWLRHSEEAKRLEQLAIDAEFEGNSELADKLYLQAKYHKDRSLIEDLEVPF